MSDEPPLQTSLTENATDVPVASARQENYALLLVMLSMFAGGTLVLLSVLLICCHRCCQSGRRYSRASDDLEKTNTTYVEESQPTQDITIRMESADTLASSSCHGEADTERFQSAVYTGRRVSFNEAAMYEQNKKDQEKGRRYTLTEGDFHHLKKARLTHLHIPTPALNILTIMECDSPKNSITLREQHHKPSISIFQTGESTPPENPSCALPGDTLNSVLDTSFSSITCEGSSETPRSRTMDGMGSAGLRMEGDHVFSPAAEPHETAIGVGGSSSGQGSMLHFLSRLRRHASLEGASPYFTIKKWKLHSRNRAASLDMRGSPRRRAFQRQRAASETLDQAEEDSQQQVANGGRDFLLCALSNHPNTEPPRRLSARSLETSSVSCSMPPAPLSRLEVKAVLEVNPGAEDSRAQIEQKIPQSIRSQVKNEVEENGENNEHILGATGGEGISHEGTLEFGLMTRQESLDHPNMYRDIWNLRASLEQYASSDLSSNDRDSTRSDADSVSSLGGPGASRTGLTSYQSQDIDDDIDEDNELPYDDVIREGSSRRNGRNSVDSERGADSEAGSRKLLQMDSGYASIEAPCKAPEELRLFGSNPGKTASERRRFFTNSGRKETVCESFETRLFKEELEEEASEGSISTESEAPSTVPQSEPSTLVRDTPELQAQTKARKHFRRRDYSIDERTEALFNEFLRHDPQFDQQSSPLLRHRHRSRIHLRKQWQRTKQYSDPGGARYSLERQRSYTLRRGDSANYPLDTRYHSTLPRIASAADEEVSEGATNESTESPEEQGSGPAPEDNSNNSSNNTSPRLKSAIEGHPIMLFSTPSQDNAMDSFGILEDCGTATGHSQWHTHMDADIQNPENIYHFEKDTIDKNYMHSVVDTSPSNKLVSNLDDWLYTSLRKTQSSQECMVSVTHVSPDHNQD
ncbi:voltage-dependent calcium channel beta subunit-associated regulatory protein [Trichomycterus rosablanca]|uniref:voltage-dependent calcium channel beta subunit-associated regulatory protein n=1 Tax=Trichomycterus rosablanca TaxID=2290929 RepID=UPI002F356B2F